MAFVKIALDRDRAEHPAARVYGAAISCASIPRRPSYPLPNTTNQIDEAASHREPAPREVKMNARIEMSRGSRGRPICWPAGRLLFAMSLLVLASCTSLDGRPDAPPDVMPFEVTADEQEQALALVAASRDYAMLSAEQPLYLVSTEVLRDKGRDAGDEDDSRHILVTHYAPAGDVALLSVVDVQGRALISSEAIPHLPVRLSQAEYEIARELALQHPTVQRALDGRPVEVEVQLTRTGDRDDPLFGHRVVYVLLKTADGYLEDPVVYVDITAREVLIDPFETRSEP